MRKLILYAIILLATYCSGHHFGISKLNKAASYAASKSIHGVKVSWVYIVSEWEEKESE